MPLDKVTYVNGVTVIAAKNLNDIQDAILALDSGKQDNLVFDSSPTEGSTNPVTSGGVFTALGTKQNTLTFDNAPTDGSTNPVTSGGVYSSQEALALRERPRTGSLTLGTSWSGSGPYTQNITISGYTATANTRVDLCCEYSEMLALSDMGVKALRVINNNGTLRVNAVGAPTSSSVTVNVLVYETA